MYTDKSNSLARQKYYIDDVYYHLYIPSEHDVCTFMDKCACDASELERQLNESIKIFEKYYHNPTVCYHDSNYNNIYLEKNDYYLSPLIAIASMIFIIISLVYLYYISIYIGLIFGYVFGCREFLDSFDKRAYDDNREFITHEINDLVLNPTSDYYFIRP